MPRPPRLQYEGAVYHVISRGNRRERIVWNERDYGKLETMMIEAMNWSGVMLGSWSLMPNHVHALVETPEANLAEFMQRWLTRYAQYFNWAHRLVGHVFQGRYKSLLCERDSYLKELIRYIHLNPYRGKEGALAKLGCWKWSSHRFYIGQQAYPGGTRQAIESMLGLFGDDLPTARQSYAQFLADGLKDGNWEDFYQPKAGCLGNEGFVKQAEERTQRRIAENEPRAPVSLTDLLEMARRRFGMTSDDLRSPSQKRSLTNVRQALAVVGQHYAKISLTSLAAVMGRDPSAVSQMIRRANPDPETNARIRELLEALQQVDKA